MGLSYCNVEIYEEGEEGPGDKDGHHEADDGEIRDQPGQQEAPPLQPPAHHHQDGGEQVGGRGGHKAAQEIVVVQVEPVQAAPHRLGHFHVPVVAHQPGIDPLPQLGPGVLSHQAVERGEQHHCAAGQRTAADEEEAAPAPAATAAAACVRHDVLMFITYIFHPPFHSAPGLFSYSNLLIAK